MLTGAKSSVYLGVETTFGTAATAKYKIPFKSESINQKIEYQASEALLGLRGVKSMAIGKTGVEGSMDVELYPATSGVLFYLALGNATGKTTYSEIIPISLTQSLPSASIEVDHAGQAFRYLGMKANRLRFTGSVGAIPSVSIDFIGVEEQSGALTHAETLTEPNNDPFYFTELKLYTDNFTTLASLYSSVELEINNNLDGDDYRLDGTGKRKSIDAQKLEITGSIDIIFDASAVSGEYTKFKNATDGALGIELSKSSGEKIQIYLPRLRFTEMTHDIEGPDKIVLKASFTALLPNTEPVITVKDYVNTSGTY